jgi:hypothetical protein
MEQWLRHCATSRRVPGSIPRWCHWRFFISVASDNSMCQGSTQALKMSTRILLGVKTAAPADKLPPSSVDVTESGSLNLPEPSGPHRPVMGMLLFEWLRSAAEPSCDDGKLYVSEFCFVPNK